LTESMELLCPSCGHANPVDAQFCRQCGAILVRSRDARKRESESPGPQPSPQIVEPVSGPRRGALLAAVAGLLTLVVAFVVYQRFHTNELIPVPGDATPPAPPAEAPAEQAVAQPTASGQLREAPAKPEAPAVREEARARNLPTHEPFVEPTLAPRAAERREEVPSRRQPGWYRVRYRSPLFQAPSETAPIITQLPVGTRIRVTRVLPGFLAVESTTGKAPGFVSSDDVLPESVAGPAR
jgi:ribosomal protein L40E